MVCEFWGDPNKSTGKHPCNHPEKILVQGREVKFCENICFFKKCPKGVVNP